MAVPRQLRWGTAALALALLWAAVPGAAVAAQMLNATMIYASNDSAPPDRRLQSIEAKLRRVFGFDHYKLVGEGSAAVDVPGSATIPLGGGYALQVQATGPAPGGVMANVTWKRGGQVLLSTRTRLGRAPTVLGGASHQNGKLIVTLTVR